MDTSKKYENPTLELLDKTLEKCKDLDIKSVKVTWQVVPNVFGDGYERVPNISVELK